MKLLLLHIPGLFAVIIGLLFYFSYSLTLIRINKEKGHQFALDTTYVTLGKGLPPNAVAFI